MSGATDIAFDPETLMSPAELYELAERRQWSADALAFDGDRAQWRELAPGLRERLLWHAGAFFVGEDAVATQLDPLIAAAADAGERAFLVSQRTDEIRHARCFDRFYAEVVDAGGDGARRLALARAGVGAPLIELLDVRLERAARALADDPGDLLAKIDFVTVYHLIVEGMLAICGQRMLLEFLADRRLLPGWSESLRLIARDEHRHVAYGAWLLSRHAHDPAVAARVAGQLRALVPLACAVLVPPGSRPERFRPLDWTGTRLLFEARDGLRRRLAATGLQPPHAV